MFEFRDLNTLVQLYSSEKSFKTEYQKIFKTLNKFGLSKYESSIYLALIMQGSSTAEKVAKIAKIPRTSSYKTLMKLRDKGFVILAGGRPQIFKPVKPGEISTKMINEIKETVELLDSLYEIITIRGQPQQVYTLLGKEFVIEKIGELIDKSERKIILSTPKFPELRNYIEKRLINALTRNIEIHLITKQNIRVPQSVIVHRNNALIATNILIDDKIAFIAAPDLSAAGYTDNERLSGYLASFLNELLKDDK